MRAPPDGVPIDPIIVPYAIENKTNKIAFFPSGVEESTFLIMANPIGSIIAIIVCSPKKEERTAETTINPARNNRLLFPKMEIMIFANLISSP